MLKHLQGQQELDSTREILRRLEQYYDAMHREEDGDDRATRLTLQSLKAVINQLKEVITRFEGRTTSRQKST